ncbi:MAG: S9 family peptidase [Phycisphaerales bacterium]|nr:S9 family peptidase [Phycisphaerales bacterium]
MPTRTRSKAATAGASAPRASSARTGTVRRKRPVAIDDLRSYQYISDPQLSPDGSRVVFVRKVAGAKPGQMEAALGLVPTRSGTPRPFTSGPRDGHPRWSPDGSTIAFVRAEEKHLPQIHLIGADGGEARVLTRFKQGTIASFKWSPDGRHLAVRYRETDPGFTEEAKKGRTERGDSDPPRVLDTIWYRLDGDGYFNGQRFALHLVEVATGSSRVVYDLDTLGDFSFDFSPDSRRIAITTNREADAILKPWADRLIVVELASGKIAEPKGQPEGPKSSVAWSPDGRSVAWAGRADRTGGLYSTENLRLWTLDLAAQKARCLTCDDDVCLLAATLGDSAEVSFAPSIQWTRDSRHLLTRIGWQGQGRIAAVPRAGGKLVWLTSGGDMHLGSQSTDGASIALLRIGPTTLPEVHLGTLSRTKLRTRALTDFNGPLLSQLELATPESHWVESTDGVKVQTWVLRPPGTKRGTRLPAVLQVHGGPHAQYGEVYFHEMQVLAAAGYIVFMSNPRGSKGYGRDFCAAIRGAWGTKDWEDIQSVTRFMQVHPSVDTRRMAVMGGSYGGYMTNWAIGHTDVFRCAITDRCVSNLLSMAGSSDYPDLVDEYWPGAVWDRWERRWESSPIKHFGGVKTPTLIIHSEGDLRCNVEQGEQVHAALTILGVPTRFVRYPASTSHGLSRGGPPDLRMHRLTEIVGWLGRWLGARGPAPRANAKRGVSGSR